MVADNFTQLPNHKKASNGPVVTSNMNQLNIANTIKVLKDKHNNFAGRLITLTDTYCKHLMTSSSSSPSDISFSQC